MNNTLHTQEKVIDLEKENNNTVLDVQHLKKSYGKKQALQDVTFSVQKGTCFGLLGPNGAGKSTTMKILTGITKASSGASKLFGYDAAKNQHLISQSVGYVPQEITLYDQLSAYENLNAFGQMYGMNGLELKSRITAVLEETGLSERAKDPVKTFSGGMKRRINMGAALLHNPQLLILDEPTVGIDPHSRNHIFDMIRKLNQNGVTIIYSTHYMEEVETLCDTVAIIDDGNVKAHGPLGELLNRYGRRAIYIEGSRLKNAPDITGITKSYKEGSGWILETDHVDHTMQQLLQLSSKEQWGIKQLKVVRPTLEHVFLSVTGTALRDA